MFRVLDFRWNQGKTRDPSQVQCPILTGISVCSKGLLKFEVLQLV